MPGPGQQAGAEQRGDQPQALRHRLQRRVGLAQQVAGDQVGEQRGLPGGDQAVGRAVPEHHGVDQPDLAPAAHQQQRADQRRAAQVGPDQQRPAPQPVDDHPGQRRGHAPADEREERQPGRAVAAGKDLDPDPHGQPQGAVADDGEALPGDVDAGVAVGDEPAHVSAP